MRFFTREFPHKSWILVGVVHSETLIHTRIQDFGDLGNFFVLGPSQIIYMGLKSQLDFIFEYESMAVNRYFQLISNL